MARMLPIDIARGSRRVARGDEAVRHWRALLFVTLIMTLGRTGAYWDVQWHWAVGRDSFFIPPHDLIYASVVLSGALALAITWLDGSRTGWHRPRPWGWMTQLVGVGLILAAAPFDDLWHRWYGIDVTIWSPPHVLGVFGSWVNHAGLVLSWAVVWRATERTTEGRKTLIGLCWSMCLLVSMLNFGLIPAVRWSVLQPVSPVLYSALGSLFIPAAFVALLLITGKASTVWAVLGGLILLRLIDQLVWLWGLAVVVPLWGQAPRRIDAAGLYRHFWMHPLLNGAAASAIIAGAALQRRITARAAALSGVVAGIAIAAAVQLLSSGAIIPVIAFVDAGQTGRDFHVETDWLFGLLGTSGPAAVAWAILAGALSGLAGYGAAGLLNRLAMREHAGSIDENLQPRVGLSEAREGV